MTVLSSLRCVGTPVRDGRWRVGGGASRGGVARARASAGSAEREQFRMRFVRSFVVVVAVFVNAMRRARAVFGVE